MIVAHNVIAIICCVLKENIDQSCYANGYLTVY